MKSHAKNLKIIALIIFIVLAILIGKYVGIMVFDREYISSTIMGLGAFAPLAYMGLYFIATIFFFPGTPLTILGGFLFGEIYGTIYAVFAATLGASVAFFISRFLGKGFVDDMLSKKLKKVNKYDDKLKQHGFITTLFLRLIPLFPFNGLNFAMGVTRVRFKDYLIATMIGIIPGTFILTSIGNSVMDMATFKLYLFIVLFVLLAASPTIYKKIKDNHKKKGEKR